MSVTDNGTPMLDNGTPMSVTDKETPMSMTVRHTKRKNVIERQRDPMSVAVRQRNPHVIDS